MNCQLEIYVFDRWNPCQREAVQVSNAGLYVCQGCFDELIKEEYDGKLMTIGWATDDALDAMKYQMEVKREIEQRLDHLYGYASMRRAVNRIVQSWDEQWLT